MPFASARCDPNEREVGDLTTRAMIPDDAYRSRHGVGRAISHSRSIVRIIVFSTRARTPREDDYPVTTRLERWPSWTMQVLKWSKEQGGVVGYSHRGWGLALPDTTPDGSRKFPG